MNVRQLISFVVICLSFKSNNVNGQQREKYIDSINLQIHFVDSLIERYFEPSDTTVSRSITHFTCITRGGASSELYRNSKNDTFYKLVYSSNCDGEVVEQNFYFRLGKIVFARIVLKDGESRRVIEQYYLNDHIFNNNTGKSFIKEGYALLEKTK